MRQSLRLTTDRPPPPPAGRLAPVPRFGLLRRVAPGVAAGVLTMGVVLARVDRDLPPPDAAPLTAVPARPGPRITTGPTAEPERRPHRPADPISPTDVSTPPGVARDWEWDDGF